MRPAEKRRASRITSALIWATVNGQMWAFRAIADALDGTVDGAPPPIDLDTLFQEHLSVRETLRRIWSAYSRHP